VHLAGARSVEAASAVALAEARAQPARLDRGHHGPGYRISEMVKVGICISISWRTPTKPREPARVIREVRGRADHLRVPDAARVSSRCTRPRHPDGSPRRSSSTAAESAAPRCRARALPDRARLVHQERVPGVPRRVLPVPGDIWPRLMLLEPRAHRVGPAAQGGHGPGRRGTRPAGGGWPATPRSRVLAAEECRASMARWDAAGQADSPVAAAAITMKTLFLL